MFKMAVALARMVLPRWLYRLIGTYYLRLLDWAGIARMVRGVTALDQFFLWLSIGVSPFTSLRALRTWQDPLLLHDIVVSVPGAGVFAVRAHTDDLWHVAPAREAAVFRYIRENLKAGDCFVDAGSNIGFYAITAAAIVGSGGSVVAIEMLKVNADILRDNIARNNVDCVKVVEKALSDSDGNVIVASMPTGSFGQATINDQSQKNVFSVETATLNSILAQSKNVRLLKMDIEGAEYDALLGATDVIGRIDAIIFEHLTEKSSAQIANLLEPRGFRIERLDGRNSVAIQTRW